MNIDQQQAGRTTGMMMGLMAHQPGENVDALRSSGFQRPPLADSEISRVLSQRFPHLQLGEVLAGEITGWRIDRLEEAEP